MTRMWIFRSSNAEHARAARRSFVKRLGATASAADCWYAEVIFGELVSNVVRHAPGTVAMWLELNEENAVLYAHDDGPGCTATRPFLGGLNLVGKLSPQLCINRVPYKSGTQISVVLPLRAA